MKNIHVLPGDIHKPSRLYFKDGDYKLDTSSIAMDWFISSAGYKPQHIYITSDKKIKEGDWYLNTLKNTIDKCEGIISQKNVNLSDWLKKIILTTDQDLVKDGVQKIDDEFLEWFVKNPSCEEVEVHELKLFNPDTNESGFCKWELDIPKEEPKQNLPGIDGETFKVVLDREWFPKQETLEEAAEKYANDWEEIHPELSSEDMTPIAISKLDFIYGAKWQQERMYTEEELRNAMNWMLTQYFEFHEWPATGRMDHYVQSIKQQEQ